MNNEELFLNLIEEMEKKLYFPKDTFTVKKDNRIRGLYIDLFRLIHYFNFL